MKIEFTGPNEIVEFIFMLYKYDIVFAHPWSIGFKTCEITI
jgi:hypothetical protein